MSKSYKYVIVCIELTWITKENLQSNFTKLHTFKKKNSVFVWEYGTTINETENRKTEALAMYQ